MLRLFIALFALAAFAADADAFFLRRLKARREKRRQAASVRVEVRTGPTAGASSWSLTPPPPAPSQRKAPAKAAPLHRSHNCPKCGTPQFRVHGTLPGGRHTHKCNKCGTVWSH